MTKRTTAKEKEIQRLMGVYKCSRIEAEELYEFDKNHTGSDEDTKTYLSEELFMEESVVEGQFYKMAKEKPTMTRVQQAEATRVAKDLRAERLEYLSEALGVDPMFGPCVEADSTTVKFTAPDTGFGISVKVMRHKDQKVVTKAMKKRQKRNAEGKMVEVDWTQADLRAMVLHKVIEARPDLFEAPSFAGTKAGMVDRNEKYPFGSVTMTHHKS